MKINDKTVIRKENPRKFQISKKYNSNIAEIF